MLVHTQKPSNGSILLKRKGDLLGTEEKETPTGQLAGGLTEEEMEYLRWFLTQATEKEKAIVRLIVKGSNEG